MKDWLIEKLGGFTQKELGEAVQREQENQYRYYLNLRREELCRDLTSAKNAKRKYADIQRRLNAVTKELVGIENNIEESKGVKISKELKVYLGA